MHVKLPYGEKMSRTFSAGVAGFGGKISNVEAVINAADKALYWSKEAGRNRVSVAGGGRVDLPVVMTEHGGKAPRIIAVWSPLPAGKTFVAANLAAVLT